ncbi:hypothetical protein [Caulifigura coniformis]|nr:hypothetical protein [Caulifigura coniformis]
MSNSRRFALNGADLRKLGTGLMIALVGAVATFLSEVATSLDFGIWSPFVSMGLSVLVNAIRKWITDNSPPPAASAAASRRKRPRKSAGWTIGSVILVLTVLTVGLISLVALVGSFDGEPDQTTPDNVPAADLDAVTRTFVLQRQLFARVCLEAAKRERAGLISSEEEENAWCEPRWAAARSEAFGTLAESRDRQLRDGWTPAASAAGLEAWAVAADPSLAAEVTGR